MLERNEQTICAVSTPHGTGGISVIRVSGSQALSICQKHSLILSTKKIESHRLYFSDFLDLQKNKVDEVVFSYFANGKSFTGEEVIEISCHGSPFITQQILDLLVQSGCRIAERGEFTFRAFMNGRIDLVQAESVLSLIESQNKAASKLALRQLDGVVSQQFNEIISDLTWCLAHIEASIDFIEQGIEVVNNQVLVDKLLEIRSQMQGLILSYRSGRLVRDGIRVALVGSPNVGKSSLLNLFLQDEKAIVTPIAGTTRDVIEGDTLYNGVKFRFVDTAGLRDTHDQVELIGINRSHNEIKKADLVCVVIDPQQPFQSQTHLHTIDQGTPVVYIVNKADVATPEQLHETRHLLKDHVSIVTSAQQKKSRGPLFEFIRQQVGDVGHLDEAVISSARQLEQLQVSHEMISKSLVELENNMGAEFVAMYLKEALVSMQKILGQVYDDQIMDRVFKEFCLGK